MAEIELRPWGLESLGRAMGRSGAALAQLGQQLSGVLGELEDAMGPGAGEEAAGCARLGLISALSALSEDLDAAARLLATTAMEWEGLDRGA